jgi:hypothetical protein
MPVYYQRRSSLDASFGTMQKLAQSCMHPFSFCGDTSFPFVAHWGERDSSKLPNFQSCQFFSNNHQVAHPLKLYGRSGGIVSKTVVEQ